MNDPNDPRPIRVLVFPDRDDAILIYVPHGTELWLPRLRSPFLRHDVANKLGAVDIAARVAESVPGRFTSALGKAFKEHRAEVQQRAREQEAARRVAVRSSPAATTYEAKRRELVDLKEKIDSEHRLLKEEVGRAKARAATTGSYMPIGEYRKKTARIAELQDKSLAIQHQLGQLRAAEKEFHKIQSRRREEIFIDLVRQRSTKDEFEALWAEVDRLEKETP